MSAFRAFWTVFAIAALFFQLACATLPIKAPTAAQIETDMGLGSGFFISPHVFVTAAHVVNGVKEARVYVDGRASPAMVMKVDEKNDIATLATTLPGKPVQLSCRRPHVLDPISVDGFPMGWPKIAKVEGRVASDYLIMGHLLAADIEVLPGNSGSPVYANGKVVGMADALVSIGDGLFQHPSSMALFVPGDILCNSVYGAR